MAVTGRARRRGKRRDPTDASLEIIDLPPDDSVSRSRDDGVETLERRRGPVIVAAIVVVALVGVTIASWTRHSSRRATSTTTDASHTNIDLRDHAIRAAPLFPFRVGAQLLTGGTTGLRLVDTETGQATIPAVTGLPIGAVTIVAHSGAAVAVRAATHLYWFTMTDRVAHRFDATVAFASAQPGYLWLASPHLATEVPGDDDGLPRTRIATEGLAVGATTGGLLIAVKAGIALQPGHASTAHLLLRAPATVIAVHPDRVAWVSSDCNALNCAVSVTTIATGATSPAINLVGPPNQFAVSKTSGVFSPDGNFLAIVVPDDHAVRAQVLYVADLRTFASTSMRVDGTFEQPATPGSSDTTGMTIDWTRDSAFLVLGTAPEVGADRIDVMNPKNPLVLSANVALGTGTSVAVIGPSSVAAPH